MLILKIHITLAFRGLLSENFLSIYVCLSTCQNTPSLIQVLKLIRQKTPEMLPFSVDENLPMLHISKGIFINVGQGFPWKILAIYFLLFFPYNTILQQQTRLVNRNFFSTKPSKSDTKFNYKNCHRWKSLKNPWIWISMFLCVLRECATYIKIPFNSPLSSIELSSS